MNNSIFIPGNVPSLKNSKTWTGKRLIMSKSCMIYEKESKNYYKDMDIGLKNGSPPYYIGFYFIRKSKHRFDYINAAQMPLDLMVKNGIILDDDSDNVIPVFMGYHHDKDNPGMVIKVLPQKSRFIQSIKTFKKITIKKYKYEI